MSDSIASKANKERSAARVDAINLLARREHSYYELQQKLQRKHPDSDLIADVLTVLVQQDLQSDERYSGAFIRSRCRKGQGAYRIRKDLQSRGVAESVIASALSEQQVDWFELAREVAERRFGTAAAHDFNERSKRARFLLYRGFDSEQIRFALEACHHER